MNAEKINKINKWILVVFLVIQPILELFLAVFEDEGFSIAGISIATLIRYGMLAVMVLLAVVFNMKRKSTKIFIGTMCIYGIYCILHFLNNHNYNEVMLGATVNAGIVPIFMYLSRYIIPVCIVYLVYLLNFRYKELKITVIAVTCIFSVVMIGSNLLKMDNIAYSFGGDAPVAASMLKWFDPTFEYSDWRMLTSRGLYASGNELSAIFILLLPITMWIAFKEKNKTYFLAPFALAISMLLVSTRVSAYGAVIVFIASPIIYLLDRIFAKEKIEKSNIMAYFILIIAFGVFFVHSPFLRRIQVGEGGVNEYVVEENKKDFELTEQDNTPERIFIKENFQKELIPFEMIDQLYSYLDHTDFWVHMIQDVKPEERNNARKLKTFILEDIKNEKNGKLDDLVGIGEIPVYPERDYVSQYYYIGILGIVLFLVPFMIVLVIAGMNELLKLFAKRLDGLQATLLVSFVAIMGTGYLAGHALEPIYINTFIGLITGMIVSNLYKRNKGKVLENGLEKYIQKIESTSKEKFVEELEEKIEKNCKTFIVTANPETLMIAKKNPEFDKCLMNKETTIVPDGIGIIKGAKLLGYPIKETITGVELAKELFRIANQKEKSIFLFGAKQEVIEKMKEMLQQNYPSIKMLGCENGYIDDKQAVFEKIKQQKPDIVLVALGIPNQELLIQQNLKDFKQGIFMGVGGSFDVLSGMKKRAPEFFVKFHLEWLYRITVEPSRLKRFWNSNIKYVFKIIQER